MNTETLSKKQIKETFKASGHAMAYALDSLGLTETMKEQKCKPSKNNKAPQVHTVRVYAEIEKAIEARKSMKKTKQGKLASALLETILEFKSEFGSSDSKFFSMVVTGNSRTVAFYIDAPQAIKQSRKPIALPKKKKAVATKAA